MDTYFVILEFHLIVMDRYQSHSSRRTQYLSQRLYGANIQQFPDIPAVSAEILALRGWEGEKRRAAPSAPWLSGCRPPWAHYLTGGLSPCELCISSASPSIHHRWSPRRKSHLHRLLRLYLQKHQSPSWLSRW